MSKRFNITGTCLHEKHYMADVSGKMKEVIGMIEKGQNLNEGYLVIFDHSATKSWQTDRREINEKNIFMVWV